MISFIFAHYQFPTRKCALSKVQSKYSYEFVWKRVFISIEYIKKISGKLNYPISASHIVLQFAQLLYTYFFLLILYENRRNLFLYRKKNIFHHMKDILILKPCGFMKNLFCIHEVIFFRTFFNLLFHIKMIIIWKSTEKG